MKLKFQERNAHWWQSGCKRYSVAICCSPNCVLPFTAFHGVTGGQDKDGCSVMPENLGACATRREAFSACVKHLRQQPQQAA